MLDQHTRRAPDVEEPSALGPIPLDLRQASLVHEGDIASVRLAEGAFDAIEHVADPAATVRKLYSLVAPGGLVTFNTPNEGGWLRRLMGRHWFHYKPQEHLYYFTPATLGRLVAEAGFEVLCTRRSGKIVTLAYLCGRMRAYSPAVARVLTATLARLPIARRPFLLPIGEFALFAERRR